MIKKFQAEGLEVSAIAFDDSEKKQIEVMGIEFFCIHNANRSINPFKVLALKGQYLRLIKKIKPDIVFTFMLKPNLYGTKAAQKAKVAQIFAMVEGSGDVFVNNSLKWRGIRWFVCKMYRSAFKYTEKVFFLNKEDKKEFLKKKLVKEKQCELINGIGVNLEYFTQKPLKNFDCFLMIARMLKSKGVLEYCQAARLVKQKHPEAIFGYLGGEGNIKIGDIQEYLEDGSICYYGEVKDVRPYLENCSIYVLPSYREGMPVSVMEAAATGRGLIVSDCPGCNATVVEGYNGYMVSVGNVETLAQKISYLIENPRVVEEMAQHSRQFAEENFNQTKINETIFRRMGLK